MVNRKGSTLVFCMIMVLLVSMLGMSCARQVPGPATPEQPTEVIEWTLESWTPPTSWQVPELELACERVSQRLDGRFVITPIWGGALGISGFDALAALSEGAFEMDFGPVSFWAADMPVLGVLGLPGLYANRSEHKLAMDLLHEVISEQFDKQWKCKLIGELSVMPPSLPFTKEPIREIQDFKGMTIRGYSPEIAAVVEALGGISITLVWSEVYSAAQRGVMEGVITSPMGARSTSFWEVFNYGTDMPFVASNTALLVNNEAFEKLPAAYQVVLIEEFTAANTRLGYRGFQSVEEDWAILEANGLMRIIPGTDLFEGIVKACDPVWDAWAQERGPLVVQALEDVKTLLGR
ncbi:Solute-binding protein [subsurface metagenome]